MKGRLRRRWIDEVCPYRRGARGTERKGGKKGETDFELTSQTEERSEKALKFMRRLESSNQAFLLVGENPDEKFPQLRPR